MSAEKGRARTLTWCRFRFPCWKGAAGLLRQNDRGASAVPRLLLCSFICDNRRGVARVSGVAAHSGHHVAEPDPGGPALGGMPAWRGAPGRGEVSTTLRSDSWPFSP